MSTRKKRSKERSPSEETLTVGGWRLYADPHLLAQIHRLAAGVERFRRKGKELAHSAEAKTLAALWKLMLETIPEDPTRPVYRLGQTLGPAHKHWLRAEFGRQRFRLFFRYSSTAKVIVYAWVNDSETLRQYGSRTDAYAVFAAMLRAGNPPADWDALVKAAKPIRSGRGSGTGER